MEFVFDRTQADVDRVEELNKKYLAGTITDEEKEEWMSDLKGALNSSDLNRIESNMLALSEMFGSFIKSKNWIVGDIPRVNDYKRILENLNTIRESWPVLIETPDNPKQPLTTYGKWNDIEKILHDINQNYIRHIESFYYCGNDVFAGEGIGIL